MRVFVIKHSVQQADEQLADVRPAQERHMFNRISVFTLAVLIMGFVASSMPAQNKKPKPTVKKVTVSAPVKANDEPADQPARPLPTKRNERPAAAGIETARTDYKRVAQKQDLPYYYEFVQPDFAVGKIVIEHDETGAGNISFFKRSSKEEFSDPLTVSQAALDRIKAAYTALDFLNSRENYQFEKDYSHLGTVTLRLRKSGKERLAAFNWTENKSARALSDEYRKLGNQFVWMFDITVARENQPLEAPKLMESLDSMIRRNEISDPTQLLPFLKELVEDERIPLMARNRAGKLIGQIQKQKK